MVKFSIVRKHEIQAAHRIYGHHGKCKNFHGHSYVFNIYCSGDELNDLGMLVDFEVLRSTICKWLDDNYDHRMILWDKDPIAQQVKLLDPSTVIVPFNPTAENMAAHILTEVAPSLLSNYPITINKIVVEESSKCSASCEL